MDFFTYNLTWMLLNAVLTLVPLIIALVLEKKLSRVVFIFLLLLWLLYLPNTIYLITDLQYFPDQFVKSGSIMKILLIVQYGTLTALGVVTYLFSLRPLENIIKKNRKLKNQKVLIFVFFNFLISFAVILGKFQRTHSWFVFTDPLRVMEDMARTILSVELMFLVIGFGIIINVIYFYSQIIFKTKKSRK